MANTQMRNSAGPLGFIFDLQKALPRDAEQNASGRNWLAVDHVTSVEHCEIVNRLEQRRDDVMMIEQCL